MRIATYNVNGVNGRLPRLLEWLREERPDVACLQEIKTVEERFPSAALLEAGYRSLVHGQRSHHGVAILSRAAAKERRRGLPGNDEDREARYLEAEVGGVVVASVYLPNGNPQPGPRFDYKLAWFERLNAHAATLARSKRPVILAGDFNVVPTNADIYNWWLWQWDAVLQPETRAASRRACAAPTAASFGGAGRRRMSCSMSEAPPDCAIDSRQAGTVGSALVSISSGTTRAADPAGGWSL